MPASYIDAGEEASWLYFLILRRSFHYIPGNRSSNGLITYERGVIAFLSKKYYNPFMDKITKDPETEKYDVILSIHPKYAELIKNLKKRFEFRKRIFKRPIRNIYLYVTMPQRKISGWFPYTGYRMGSIEEVWECCKDYAGITKKEYLKYYFGQDNAYAIFINNYEPYPELMEPEIISPKFTAPQSYCYIKEK